MKVKKILYMLQISPCHMSDFGVLLIEVYLGNCETRGARS